MLRQKTLLVLGAGSSKDFKFPLGPELTDQIAQAVTFDLSGFEPAGGHPIIRTRLAHMRMNQPHLFNSWIAACEYVRRNIHLANSVDRFIESNRGDLAVVAICKFAIALLIADCEKQSPFGDVSDFHLKLFDFSPLKSTWITKLFHHLHSGVSADDIATLFSHLRVVSFNYDRLFERFLSVAIANFYSLPINEATQLVTDLGVVHVYGSLGGIQEHAPGYRPFGVFGNNPDDASHLIRTFHESAASEIAERVGEYMEWSDRVVVLGLSYAEMNTNFLAQCAPNLDGIRPVFGTCFKMSEQNAEVARVRMDGVFAKHNACTRLYDVDCPKFFDDLALTI